MIFIHRDFNKVLLYLIIVPLILLSLSTIYYQGRLRSISIENKLNKETLESLTGKLALAELNRTVRGEMLEDKDKSILEQGYNELKTENERLMAENEELRNYLYPAKAASIDGDAKADKLYQRFNQIQNDIIETNQKVSRLSLSVKDLCKKLESAGESDNIC